MNEALGANARIGGGKLGLRILAFASIAGVLPVLAACDPGPKQPANPSVQAGGDAARGPLATNTQQLSGVYRQDAAAAQAKYGNRQLHVTGVVEDIQSGNGEGPVIHFSHDVSAIVVDKPSAATVASGQIVKVICSDVSSTPAGPSLKNCTVQPPLKF